jgi:hypothetical protein
LVSHIDSLPSHREQNQQEPIDRNTARETDPASIRLMPLTVDSPQKSKVPIEKHQQEPIDHNAAHETNPASIGSMLLSVDSPQ